MTPFPLARYFTWAWRIALALALISTLAAVLSENPLAYLPAGVFLLVAAYLYQQRRGALYFALVVLGLTAMRDLGLYFSGDGIGALAIGALCGIGAYATAQALKSMKESDPSQPPS